MIAKAERCTALSTSAVAIAMLNVIVLPAKHDWNESSLYQQRLSSHASEAAQAFNASTCPSSSPKCGSVGTSKVGSTRRFAHS